MSERLLLEYQKTIPKSLRIITNISHTSFFKELEKLSDDKISNFFHENLLRFPIPNIFSKNTKYEIVIRNHTESDKYSMNWHYDNKQLIKHKISDLQKIHSLQIVSMDENSITIGIVNPGARDSFLRSESDVILRQAFVDVVGVDKKIEVIVDSSIDTNTPAARAVRVDESPSDKNQLSGPELLARELGAKIVKDDR